MPPTLRGLASFVYSGGGDLFDDAVEPTSLAFSSDQTREALTPTLELLRDPSLTLTDEQLRSSTPLELFESGKLGMITGFRSETPELRATEGLSFDVMPMPTIDDDATIGELSGLCISSQTATLPAAADLLVYLVSSEAVARVTSAGYLVPANLEVARSNDFLQPQLQPAQAGLFTDSIRSMRLLPLIDSYAGARGGRRGAVAAAAAGAGARRRGAHHADRRAVAHGARPRRGLGQPRPGGHPERVTRGRGGGADASCRPPVL